MTKGIMSTKKEKKLRFKPPKRSKFEEEFQKAHDQMMNEIFGKYPKKPTKAEKRVA